MPVLLALLAFLLSAAPGAAQSLPGATEASRAEARALVEAIGMTGQMRQMVPPLAQSMVRSLAQTNPGDAAAAQQVVDEILMPEILAHLSEMSDLAVEVYAAQFTAEDLRDLRSFYETPVGRRLIAAQPVIATQMFQFGAAWGQRTAQAAIAKHAEELRKRGFKL